MKKNKIKTLIFIIIGVALTILLINLVQNNNLKKEEKQANEYTLKGDYKKALEKYSLLSNKNKRNPIWYCKISEIYALMDEEEKSKEFLNKAKNMKFIKYEEATSCIIFQEFSRGQYKEAKEHGEIALKKYKKNKNIKNTMISLYTLLGEKDKAKELINNYPLNKKSSEELASYGRMCMNLSYYTKAFDNLKEAYKLDKDNMIIYDCLSESSSKDFDSMVKRIDNMRKKYPNEVMYKIWLAKVYSLKETTCEESLKLLRGNDIDKNSLSIKLIKLSIYSNLGDFHNADKIAKELSNDYKNDYRVLHSMAWYYLKKGDLDKSKECCIKSIEINSNYVDNYGYLMPEICKYKKQKDISKIYFSKALYLCPYNYNLMTNTGDYYWYVCRDLNKSLKYYTMADKIKRNDSYIKYNIALIYIDNNKKEGIDLLKKCIELKPSENKYYRTLSVIYLNKGNYSEVEKYLQKAVSNDKNDLMALNNMAVYYIVGKSDVDKGYSTINNVHELVKKRKDYDVYTINIINKNFEKIKDLYTKYKAASSPTLPIPELNLFY